MSDDPTEIETLQAALRAMDEQIGRFKLALEIIAGARPPTDNLLGHSDVARIALKRG